MISIFPIMNFQFICSNIPAAPAYGVYISQLIRYSRPCDYYHDLIDRGLPVAMKLLNQRSIVKLKPSLRQFYGHHHDLFLIVTEYLCHKRPRIFFVGRNHNPVLSSFMTYHMVCNKNNTTDATCGAGSAYPSGVQPQLLVGLVLVDLCFLCNVLQIVVCPFVTFLLFTDSDYSFGSFNSC